MDSTSHHDYMAEITDLAKENKELRKRLDDWIYELAYYTEDEVATPKGVRKFIEKALDDKVKENKECPVHKGDKCYCSPRPNFFNKQAQPKLSKDRIVEICKEVAIKVNDHGKIIIQECHFKELAKEIAKEIK